MSKHVVGGILTIFIKRLVSVVVFQFCLFINVNAAQYVSHSSNNDSLIIKGDEYSIQLTPYNQTAIEVTFSSQHHLQLPSYAITPQAKKTHFRLKQTETELTYNIGELSAVINKQNLAISFYRNGEKLIAQQDYRESETGLAFDFSIGESEKLLGGGQRVLGMDRRGHKLPLYNKAHYGYTTESKQMYFGLPAVMSSNKYVLLFDNSASGEMDLDSAATNTVTFSAVSGRASYIVVSGNDYPSLINHYVELTGKQPMPPRWALGNFASRFGYHSQQEVIETVEKFKQDDIPLDAIVLDLYWFGKDIKGHMGNLDWDLTAFPTPEKMIAGLQNEGVETIVITEPFVLSTSKKWQSAVDSQALAVDAEDNPYQFDFYFGNTGLIDVFNQVGQDWFSQPYHLLASQGVTGWWGDLGEPEVQPDDILHTLDNGKKVRGDAIHNVYGHKWAEMVFNQSQQFAPNVRPMIMMRSGFAGSQRFGMIPWTGDVSRSWGGLKPQVELSLQMGLLGLAYTHSDLGGFAGGEKFDAEMYTRWLQYGAFQPVYRPHAQENIAPEPVFHDEKTKAIVRDFIKLRYRLLPYNYTLAFENSTTGMPLMRPLFLENAEASMIEETASYLWGDAFLVTPVTDAGATKVSTQVPNGYWFNFWNDEVIEGGKVIEQSTQLETIPVLVKAGSFVPMAENMPNTKAYDASKLTLHYYHHESVGDAYGQLYEDDGISLNSIETRAYQLTSFHATYQDSQLVIDFKSSGDGYQGKAEYQDIQLIIHHWQQAPQSIALGGRKVPIFASERAFKLASAGAYWDKSNRKLMLKSLSVLQLPRLKIK